MVRRLWIFLGAVLSVLVPQTANAAKYEIVFEEGAFNYDPGSTPEDLDNKYLARVTVKKDGNVVTKDLRGSTLPDAWVFYHRWHVELKQASPPSDADIDSMFENFEQRTATLRDANAKLGETSLADIANITDVLNRVPALRSGDYPFEMGMHKGGQSEHHGHPYVPRLLGGTQEKPYDPADSSSKATATGGFIRTMNKNNAQNQKYLAAGINVHDGRKDRDYKDSEGCLTIRPQDWKGFYRALPSPEDWTKDKHVGVVSVRRATSAQDKTPPLPPTDLTVGKLGAHRRPVSAVVEAVEKPPGPSLP